VCVCVRERVSHIEQDQASSSERASAQTMVNHSGLDRPLSPSSEDCQHFGDAFRHRKSSNCLMETRIPWRCLHRKRKASKIAAGRHIPDSISCRTRSTYYHTKHKLSVKMNENAHTQTCSVQNTHTHKFTHIHIHSHTHMHTHTHAHTHTRTHTLKHRQTDRQTHTHTHIHTRTRARARTHTHTHSLSLVYSNTHALACTHTCTHAHTRTHAHTHKDTCTISLLRDNIHYLNLLAREVISSAILIVFAQPTLSYNTHRTMFPSHLAGFGALNSMRPTPPCGE